MAGQKILKVYFTDHLSEKQWNNVPILRQNKEVVIRNNTFMSYLQGGH
jgi:hypothetical protein